MWFAHTVIMFTLIIKSICPCCITVQQGNKHLVQTYCNGALYCVLVHWKKKNRTRDWFFFKFYFVISLLLSRATVSLPLSFLLPLVNKLLYTHQQWDGYSSYHRTQSDNTSKVRGGVGTQTKILLLTGRLVVKGKDRWTQNIQTHCCCCLHIL